MNATLVHYEDLPEDERYAQPNNGNGREDAHYLKVEIPGKGTVYFSDAMEPEDARFSRGLGWIQSAIISAYWAGKEAAE